MQSMPIIQSQMGSAKGDLDMLRTPDGVAEMYEPAMHASLALETPVAFSEVIAALSYALDLTSKGSSGHTLRACLLGMRVGTHLHLAPQQMADLYYGLLLKDAGCSQNAAQMCELMGMDETVCKRAARTFDWSRFELQQLRFVLRHAFGNKRVLGRAKGLAKLMMSRAKAGRYMMTTRCAAGARVAHKLGMSSETANAIRSLDEHWDGAGQPEGLLGSNIPLLAQIRNIAQNLEVVEQLTGRDGAIAVLVERSGRWFDPQMVASVQRMHRDGDLWGDEPDEELMQAVVDLEPRPRAVLAEETALDDICSAFAEIIDAKSHYTFLHSREVARHAVAIGVEMDLDEWELRDLRRAALLHDIGKLGVPNTVLDKAGELNADEWAILRRHPADAYRLLRRIPGFETIALIARSHHEKMDGSGYPDGLVASQLGVLARILVVADVYDALSSKRPYRQDLTQEQVMAIMAADTPHALDRDCFEALLRTLPNGKGLPN